MGAEEVAKEARKPWNLERIAVAHKPHKGLTRKVFNFVGMDWVVVSGESKGLIKELIKINQAATTRDPHDVGAYVVATQFKEEIYSSLLSRKIDANLLTPFRECALCFCDITKKRSFGPVNTRCCTCRSSSRWTKVPEEWLVDIHHEQAPDKVKVTSKPGLFGGMINSFVDGISQLITVPNINMAG